MRRKSHRMILKSGLPEDTLLGSARATLSGQGSVLVEGQHGVIELADTCIRLKTDAGVLTVIGKGLGLRELSLDAAMIVGEPVMTVTYGRMDG